MNPGDDQALTFGSAGSSPPPSPSTALLAALADLQPVRTRVPVVAALVLGMVLAAVPAGTILFAGARRDLVALPFWWVVATSLVWVAAIGFALVAATLPRAGHVLPDVTRARLTVTAVAIAPIVLGLFGTIDAPGHTIAVPATVMGFFGAWRGCIGAALLAGVPAAIVGALLLRNLFPIGAAWVGAAVGAAAGAVGGFALFLHCPLGGGLHAGLAHGGAVAVAALLGRLVLASPLRGPR